MRVIPSSPRARRRLFRTTIVLAVAGTIAGIALAVHSPKQPNSAPPQNAPPAQLVTRATRVTPKERRAINATLDKFLGASLDRSSPDTAWRLAGPEMKSGSTLREWRAGTSPIPYLPTREKTFGGWETVDAGPNFVTFDHLVVHPKGRSHTTASILSGEVVKSGSHWLVNRLYTIAVMKRPTKTGTHQVGPQDYAAQAASSQGASQTSGGSLGKQWLLAGAGLVGLVLLFPLGFGIASAVRSRRHQKQYAESRDRDRRELPPLPRSLQTSSGPTATGAAERQRR
jgi:hypothetical protein